jgi:hypothetical protein
MTQPTYIPLDSADFAFIKECLIFRRQIAVGNDDFKAMQRVDYLIKMIESHKNKSPLVLYEREVIGLARTLLDPNNATSMKHWISPSLFQEICERGTGTPIMLHEFCREGNLPGRHLSDLQELAKQRWEQFYVGKPERK